MEKVKKILFTTENHDWGGSELLWSKTVAALSTQSVELGVCIHEKLRLPVEISDLADKGKITLYRTPYSGLNRFQRVANRFLPYTLRFRTVDFRKKFILQFRPSLLVINQGLNFEAIGLMDFAVKSGIPYTVISHALNENLWPEGERRQGMKSGFRGGIKSFFVSNDNLETTQCQIGEFLTNAEIIRNPFNVPYNNAPSYPEATGNYELACIGRYDFYAKGQDILLRVLASEKWKKRNLRVNFYGEGNNKNQLSELIALYDLKNVSVHGQTATDEIWKKNHALILTSRFEGLPIVIVEAMLSNRIAIVTNVSGSDELLSDNETGFIASGTKPEMVDEALERAWSGRDQWKQLGENAGVSVRNIVPENPAAVFAEKLLKLIS